MTFEQVDNLEITNFESDNDMNAVYCTMLANMYLTLQTKHFITNSALQTLIEGLTDVNNISNIIINKALSKLNVDADLIDKNDIFKKYHGSNSRDAYFRTFSRKKYYKEHFNFVASIPRKLDNNEYNNGRKMYYVPILDTLAVLMNNSLFYRLWLNDFNSPSGNIKIYNDITDGKVFRNNVFFKANPLALRLILYQDTFEVCNPLGSSRKIHKLVGIYMVVANVPAYNRVHVDQIQLSALRLEKDLIAFGFNKIFEIIIKDLRYLEKEGIASKFLPLQKVKGSVIAIACDNLGSHQIGGFLENFSKSEYFCRYCHITKTDFQNGENFGFARRTQDSYNSDVMMSSIIGKSSRGIKTNSVLNQLENFHVCDGLPPCLAHDLYEGVVQYDLMLVINYFVQKKVLTI